MENAREIKDKVEQVEKDEFSSLFTRMEEDFKLWDMVSPPVTSFDADIMGRTKAHSSDIDIVSNDPRTFADNVGSTLASADRQIIVRMAEEIGEDKREDIGKLERLFAFAFEKADERLRRLLKPPLKESLIWYADIYGWTAGLFLVYKSGANVIFRFMPLDPRSLIYRVGESGLLWTGYKTYRSATDIQDEYGFDYKSLKEKDNLVIDYWKNEDGKIWNGVVCEPDIFLKEMEEQNIPSMPILIMPMSTRPYIGGADKIKGYGESLFAPIRRINAIRNRFASMIANHANLMANQALINYMDDSGVKLDTTTNVPGGVVNLSLGHNKLEPSPMKEISTTVVNIMNWLNDQMEQGMLPRIPVGTPAPSGTLYNLAQEAGNKIFNPQLRNLGYFYADICHLIEEQSIAGKIKFKIQGQEKNKYYETQITPVDLKKPHTINVEFTARTPWSQLDTYQVADMAKRQGLPQSFINEYILKLPDPKGLDDQLVMEIAEQSPRVSMLKAIIAEIKYGRNEIAETLIEDLYNFSMQEEMQNMPSEETSPRQEAIPPEVPPAPELPPVPGATPMGEQGAVV